MKSTIIGAGALLLPILALTACQRGGGQSGQGGTPGQGGTGQEQPTVLQSQQAAQQAFKEAQEAQRNAMNLEQQAQSAQQDVQQQKQKLGQAEQKAQQARQQAIQAQQQAREQAQRAQQTAAEAQQKALQGQQQSASTMQAPRAVAGTLSQRGPNEATIQVPGQSQPTRLQVTHQTQVTLDGQQSSLAQIPPGAQVRASYVVQQGQPTATKLEASSPQGKPATQGAPGQQGQQETQGQQGQQAPGQSGPP